MKSTPSYEAVNALLQENEPFEVCVTIIKKDQFWNSLSSSKPSSSKQKKFFVLEKEAPPPLASRIGPEIWTRFRGHVIVADTLKSLRFRLIVVLTWLSFALMPWLNMAVMNATFYDPPSWWFGFSYPTFYIIGLVSLLVFNSKDLEMKNKNFETIVSKMQPTMESCGFSVEYIPVSKWGYLCWGGYPYFKFTWIPDPEVVKKLQEEEEEKGDHIQPFEPNDWKPLEGDWELIPESISKPLPGCPSYGGWKLKYAVWSFGFPNSCSKSSSLHSPSFAGHHRSSITMFFSQYKRDTDVFMTTGKDNKNRLAYHQTGSPRPLLARVMEKTSIKTVGMGKQKPDTYFYRRGENGIWEVRGSFLNIYSFDFLEDVPSDDEILTGALQNLPADESCGRMWGRYKKTSNLPTLDIVVPESTSPQNKEELSPFEIV